MNYPKLYQVYKNTKFGFIKCGRTMRLEEARNISIPGEYIIQEITRVDIEKYTVGVK